MIPVNQSGFLKGEFGIANRQPTNHVLSSGGIMLA